MRETRRGPTYLYDIRAFAIKKHNPVNGRYVGTVHAKPADIVGHLAADGLVRPDISATREALPYQWRAAFDRAHGRFWFGADGTTPAHMTLRNARGRELATLFATLRAIV